MPISFDNIQITGGIQVLSAGVVPPSGDPYWANVSFLMNETSTNNQNNNTFLDESTNNFTITRAGLMTQGSFTPFTVASETSYSTSTNGGSAYFNGSLSYLSIPDNDALELGSSNFTIEFWLNTSATNGNIITKDTNENVNFGNLSVGVVAGKLQFYCNPNALNNTGRVTLTSTTTVTNSQWYHVAITRNVNTWTLYINGSSQSTATSSSAFRTSAQPLYIGCVLVSSAPGNFYTGYLSSLRIVKGTAVYTGNFTPSTTPLTAIANTSLLCNFTNAGIFDSAVKTNLVTVADAKVSTTQSKFAPTSVFLDGTGDYLLSTESSLAFALGSTFTIEGWVYPTSFASTPVITDVRNTNEAGYFAINTSGNLIARVGASTLTSTTALSLNTWNYVALVSTTSGSAFYINGTQRGTTATAAGFPATARRLYIGSQFDGTQLFVGYMQDLRITKGVARYTSNFTAPTQPFPTN